jgi:isochorismate synthase
MKGERLIDTAVGEDRSFAVWRVPGEDKFRFIAADEVQTYYDMRELNGQRGFVIAPFCLSGQFPVVCLQGREEECEWDIPDLEAYPESDREETVSLAHATTSYQKRFRRFITPLREGWMDQLALTRRVVLDKAEGFSPSTAFLKACRKYPRFYVYLFYTPYTGVWLGATPALLLSGENGNWQTEALAGTQSMVNGCLPTVWSEGNYGEQQAVADFICNRLVSAGLNPEGKGPYAIASGQLSHLKTDFFFSRPDKGHIGDLLGILHPVPAVCGLPGEDACDFIIDREGYARRYYSGFIGWLDPEGKSELYVNLRCMEIEENSLALYTGSTLLPYSTMAEGWRETENKLLVMKSVI